MGDKRRDSGEYYPGGRVIPRQPVRPGGGADPDAVHYYAETKTAAEKAQARQNIGAMSADTPIPSVDGKLPVKPLPKYLHALSFDDTYPADAEAFYDSVGGARVIGGCSIVRKGNLVGGNFDYPYDDACSFAIKVSAAKGANADGSDRHASVGAAYLGTCLTENIVSSGVNTPLYRVLPGMTESGINDAGVYAKINVIPRDPTNDPVQSSTRNLHALAAVRHVLDNFKTAEEAATYVAAHYYIPETSAYSFHWMIADAAKTYIVEDGEKHEVTGADGSMTNYRLYADDVYGTGYKRKEILDDAENVEAALAATHFTNAYADGWPWPDEFAMDAEIPHDETDALKAWADAHVTPHLDPATRKPKARDGVLWHTVHSSIYDFAAKTMRVAVQESGEYFTFAVDQVNVDLAPIEAQLAALQDGKRDKTDLDAYSFEQWTIRDTSGSLVFGVVPWNEAEKKWDSRPFADHVDDAYAVGLYDGVVSVTAYKWGGPDDEGGWFEYAGGFGPLSADGLSADVKYVGEYDWLKLTRDSVYEEDTAHKLAKRVANPTAGAFAKFDADGNLVNVEDSDGRLLTAEQRAEIAKVKDKADEYGTTWIPQNLPDGVTLYGQPVFFEEDNYWKWESNEGLSFFALDTTADAKELHFKEIVGRAADFDASLSRVLRTGDAATQQEVAAKLDTAKAIPAYSASLTYEVGEIVLHDGVAYKCVTAITTVEAWNAAHWTAATDAEIAARLKGFKSDGFATNEFAADLIGKQVAITAIDARIKTNAESAAEPTNAVTLNDNAPKTVTVATVESPATPSLAVTFGTARNGGLRICELYILNGTADTDLTFDSAVHFVSTGDSFPACEAGINYFVFAEVAANLWKVTRETLKSITTPTPVAAA